MRKLFKEAEQLKTRIYTGELGNGLLGYYSHKSGIIVIERSLPVWQFRSVLAHEIGHAYYGHTDTSHRSEYQADMWAVKKLIRLQDYIRAEQIYDGDVAKIAEELYVTKYLISTFQMTLERR